MRSITGFAGAKMAGKTTAAKMLLPFGYTVVSFADPLKRFLTDFLGLTEWQVTTPEGKETVDIRYGITPRRIMEAFATDFIRGAIPDFWVVKMRERLREISGNVVIDDIRFENEAQLIRDSGGTVVHLINRGANLAERSDERRMLLPLSERGIQVSSEDRVIDNSGSLDALTFDVFGLLL